MLKKGLYFFKHACFRVFVFSIFSPGFLNSFPFKNMFIPFFIIKPAVEFSTKYCTRILQVIASVNKSQTPPPVHFIENL